MFVYQIYGLRLVINRELPGVLLASGTEIPELVVDTGDCWPSQLPPAASSDWVPGFQRVEGTQWPVEAWTFATRDKTYWHLRYPIGSGHADFVLDQAATQVWAVWNETVSFADAVAFLLGHVLGCALRLRGASCLHGSVISKDGRALALVGPPARGKSTIAAALSEQGYAVLSDDLVVLDERDGIFWVQPGYSRLRLRPASIQALYGAADALAPVGSFSDKHYLELSREPHMPQRRFHAQALPLHTVYILGRRNPARTRTEFEPPLGARAVTNLLANNYVDYMLTRATRAEEFQRLGRLVEHVPVKKIIRPNGLEWLTDLLALIRTDFESAS